MLALGCFACSGGATYWQLLLAAVSLQPYAAHIARAGLEKLTRICCCCCFCFVSCLLQDNLLEDLAQRDWGVQQVLTSANWGGVIGNFFTGGLNLQVEHHLFPAISFMHYPAIAAIVKDECTKRGIPVRERGECVGDGLEACMG